MTTMSISPLLLSQAFRRKINLQSLFAKLRSSNTSPSFSKYFHFPAIRSHTSLSWPSPIDTRSQLLNIGSTATVTAIATKPTTTITCNTTRSQYYCTSPSASSSLPPSTSLDTSPSISPHLSSLPSNPTLVPPSPSYCTHMRPLYTLPFFRASESDIRALPPHVVDGALKTYGGLFREQDTAHDRTERLVKITRSKPQLILRGVVVSNKMDKSVVVASPRRKFATKLGKLYWRTKKFKAHDEFDTCAIGDHVILKSCRPLSKGKFFVVVENYGSKNRVRTGEIDNRYVGVCQNSGKIIVRNSIKSIRKNKNQVKWDKNKFIHDLDLAFV